MPVVNKTIIYIYVDYRKEKTDHKGTPFETQDVEELLNFVKLHVVLKFTAKARLLHLYVDLLKIYYLIFISTKYIL